MRRIDSMGFKAPAAWRDELYKNELQQIDLKRSLLKDDPQGKTLDKLKFTYFDKTVYKPNESKKTRERLQPDEINCSGAKNLKFLRGISTKRGSQNPSKISVYLKNAKEMAEIEKILINKDDIEDMKRTKQQNMEVCSRYTKNMAQSKKNL